MKISIRHRSSRVVARLLRGLVLLLWALGAPAVVRAASGPGSADTSFRPELPAGAAWVASMAVDAQARVWVAAGGGIGRLLSDGRLDPSFQVTSGANDLVLAVAVAPDGSGYVGGRFTRYAGESHDGIVRLLPDGRVDPTFRPAAAVGSRYVTALAPDVGGGVVVGGWFNQWDGQVVPEFVRLLADGALDRDFLTRQPAADPNARTSIDQIFVLPDGRFQVGGAAIWRLGGDGRVEAAIARSPAVTAWTAGSDGHLWFARVERAENGDATVRVQRIRPDGDIDPAWNRAYACDRWVAVIAAQADGKLLLGGDFSTFGGGRHAGLVRLNAEGSVDYGFVSELGLRPEGDWPDEAVGLSALQLAPGPGDAWYVRGVFTNASSLSAPGLARLQGGQRVAGPPVIREAPTILSRVEGTPARLGLAVESALALSAGWTRNGVPLADAQSAAWTLEDLRMGEAGEYQLRVTNALGVATSPVLRLEVTGAPSHPGSVDVTFRVPGWVREDVFWLSRIPVGGAVLARDGQHIYAWAADEGFTGSGGHATTNLVRFLPDGTVDSGFVAMRAEKAPTSVQAVLPLTDGRVLMEASFPAQPPEVLRSRQLVLLNADGSRDPRFRMTAERVSVLTRITGWLEVGAGRFWLAGAFKSGDPQVIWDAIRVLDDGTLDPTFRPVILPGGAASLGAQSDGRVLIVTSPLVDEAGETSARIVRCLADGTPDPSFQCSAAVDRGVLSLVVDARDRILVGLDTAPGEVGGHPILLRLLPDGALDESFAIVRDPVPSRRASLDAIALQADGRILARREYNVNQEPVAFSPLIRLEPDGRPDVTFVVPEIAGTFRTVVVTPEDQILIAGSFRDVGGTGRSGLLRLNGHDERRMEFRRATGAGAGEAFQGGIWTRLGRRYVVEAAVSPVGAAWESLATLEGNGAAQWFPGGQGPARFFRCRIEDHRER